MGEDEKRCGRCRETKPLEDFNRNRVTRDGFQASCQVCMRAYQAAQHGRNRRRHISRVRLDNLRRKAGAVSQLEAYLRTHPCVGCGTTDTRVLEFDHRPDEQKLANVSAMVGAGLPWNRILLEIATCDVRCANCHRIMTADRGGHVRQARSGGSPG